MGDCVTITGMGDNLDYYSGKATCSNKQSAFAEAVSAPSEPAKATPGGGSSSHAGAIAGSVIGVAALAAVALFAAGRSRKQAAAASDSTHLALALDGDDHLSEL